MERYEKAAPYFEKVLEEDPYNLIALDYLTLISAETDYEPDFATQTPPEVENRKGEAYQWYLNGMYQLEKENYLEAADAFVRAYKLEPDEEAYKYYSYTSKRKYELEKFKEKKAEKTEKPDLNEVLKIIQEKGESDKEAGIQWAQKARFQYNMGEKEKALIMLKISETLFPDNPYIVELEELIEKDNAEKEKEAGKEETEQKDEEKAEDGSDVTLSEVPASDPSEDTAEITPREIPPVDIIELPTGQKEDIKYAGYSEASLVQINTSDRVTLYENLSTDGSFIGGLYELPDAGKQVKKYIAERFEAAEKYFSEKKFAMATEEYEKAYRKAMEFNPEDLRAHYFLYMIYERSDRFEEKKDIFFSMLDIISNRTYRNGEYYDKAKELTDSLLFSMILQGAWNAYVSREGKKDFRISSLIQKKYVRFPIDYPIDITLPDEQIRWKFSHVHELNGFYVENNTVTSRLFGISPLISREFYIIEE